MAKRFSFEIAVSAALVSVIGVAMLRIVVKIHPSASASLPVVQPHLHVGIGTPVNDSVLRYDVGNIVAGKMASHTFHFLNPLPLSIRIANDGDIRKDCGCTRLAFSSRELEPSAAAEVTVVVDTSVKQGMLNTAASATWTAADGQKITSTFVLSGEVIPGLIASPPYLTFTSCDTGIDDEIKEVRITSLHFRTSGLGGGAIID